MAAAVATATMLGVATKRASHGVLAGGLCKHLHRVVLNERDDYLQSSFMEPANAIFDGTEQAIGADAAVAEAGRHHTKAKCCSPSVHIRIVLGSPDVVGEEDPKSVVTKVLQQANEEFVERLHRRAKSRSASC